MDFRARVPPPPLDAFVATLWACRNEAQPPGLERILPSGSAQLIVNLKEDETRLYEPEQPDCFATTSGSVLSGAHTRYQIIDTSEQEYVAGVAFKPGGSALVMRAPAHEFSDVDVPLDEIWGRARTAVLRERLLQSRSLDAMLDVLQVTLCESWTRRFLHPAVNYALCAFDRAPQTITVAAVTDRVGLSAKRFIERFKAEVGMTPKRYCRVRRFQRALTETDGSTQVDWTSVALDCGYFDQAHFIHDFRAFSGITPTAYEAARTPFRNHVKFLQSEAAGV
jgi:AraC-like DNA-binding protein